MKRKQTLKQRLSVMFFRLCQPHLGRVVEELVEIELEQRHRLTSDIRAFILDDLEQRIPREGATHALACHVRDDLRDTKAVVGRLEKRLDTLAGKHDQRR